MSFDLMKIFFRPFPPSSLRLGTLLLVCAAFTICLRIWPLNLESARDIARAGIHDDLRNELSRTLPAELSAQGTVDALEARLTEHVKQNEAQIELEVDRYEQLIGAERSLDSLDTNMPYLAMNDAYLWVRHARNYLRHGTTCDTHREGVCIDSLANAPVGSPMRYATSMHIAAIAGLHRLIAFVSPRYPLEATAFWVSVIVVALGVVPAFLIGLRLAGPTGAVVTAITVACVPTSYVLRSVGGDNDAWNVVLPLFIGWSMLRALQADTRRAVASAVAVCAIVLTLQAVTWSGWLFIYCVVVGTCLVLVPVHAAQLVLTRRCARFWEFWPVQRAAAIAIALLVVGWAIDRWIVGGGGGHSLPAIAGALRNHLFVSEAALAQPTAGVSLHWPNMSEFVAELRASDHRSVMHAMGGPVYFALALLGLSFCFAPHAALRRRHVWILAGIAVAMPTFIMFDDLDRRIGAILIVVPALVALVVEWWSGDDADSGNSAAGMLLLVWFSAAYLMSHTAIRFELLFAPPLAISLGVLVGRVSQTLRGYVPHSSVVGIPLVPIVLAGVCALTLSKPVMIGYQATRAYSPPMNDLWADVMRTLRQRSAADAIVNAWWDYGHWIKYFAERRVINDGANLFSHVPHWFGRALLSNDVATGVGLLRMLNCGSDAPTADGNQKGALGKLRAAQMSEREAYRLIVHIAGLDQAAARSELAAAGLDSSQSDDVLASTHCTPPEAHLLLSSKQLGEKDAWIVIGRWDVFEGVERDSAWHLSPAWHYCETPAGTQVLYCPLKVVDREHGHLIDAFAYNAVEPAKSRVLYRSLDDPQTAIEGEVGTLLQVTDGETLRHEIEDADLGHLGIMVDARHRRVILGSEDVLSSLFVRLMFLRDTPVSQFEKLFDRTNIVGERVVGWRIVW